MNENERGPQTGVEAPEEKDSDDPSVQETHLLLGGIVKRVGKLEEKDSYTNEEIKKDIAELLSQVHILDSIDWVLREGVALEDKNEDVQVFAAKLIAGVRAEDLDEEQEALLTERMKEDGTTPRTRFHIAIGKCNRFAKNPEIMEAEKEEIKDALQSARDFHKGDEEIQRISEELLKQIAESDAE